MGGVGGWVTQLDAQKGHREGLVQFGGAVCDNHHWNASSTGSSREDNSTSGSNEVIGGPGDSQ